MKRRKFLTGIPLAAIALGGGSKKLGKVLPDAPSGDEPVLSKVKSAMLCLQRATWEQGVAMQALLESGETDLVISMAKDAVLRQSTDGRLAMLGEEFALTDAASPGEAVLWAAKKTGDKDLMSGFDKMLDYIMHSAPRTKDGIVYHFTNIPQVWSDSLYMLPPFLASAGMYHDAIKQIEGVKNFLWNKEKMLLSHMWDCEKNEFARKDFWGVGNGWAAAGVTRVIGMLPATMDREKSLLTIFVNELLDGCIAHVRPDGFFHNIVDRPESFVETNLSQMLAYSIYRGVKGNWIDRNRLEIADRMRAAVRSKVDSLGMVQGICGSPEFDHPGTAAEGQAFFILMEAARADLLL